jgi:hypothetical protein
MLTGKAVVLLLGVENWSANKRVIVSFPCFFSMHLFIE